MKLYHGSNQDIQVIDLSCSKVGNPSIYDGGNNHGAIYRGTEIYEGNYFPIFFRNR